MEGFIGVHLGAGLHNDKLRSKYKKLINGACQKATYVLKSGGSALEACAQATAFLEDSSLTNAGYGSNLTWAGNVECDASMMDGSTLHYGAVGGVSGVKNPSLLAKVLCENQKCSLSFGRVQPSFLVGEGARIYALQCGLTTVPPAELISDESWKQYQHYRRKLRRHAEEQAQANNSRLDTVGALCIDSLGHVAAACSSGGIALKTVGRVGQAAVYASGVWAQDACGEDPAVASCTSGCGEYLVRTMLAREGALSVLNNNCTETSLHDCMKNKFLESPFLSDVDEKMCGIFVLKYNPALDIGELLWSHSTASMCVGYMSTADRKPEFRISRLGIGQEMGKCLTLEGTMFHCKRQSYKRPASPLSPCVSPQSPQSPQSPCFNDDAEDNAEQVEGTEEDDPQEPNSSVHANPDTTNSILDLSTTSDKLA